VADYEIAVEAVTAAPVLETRLLLPVAGAAVRVSQEDLHSICSEHREGVTRRGQRQRH